MTVGTRISDFPLKALVAGDTSPVVSGALNYKIDLGTEFANLSTTALALARSFVVATRTALTALATATVGDVVFLKEAGRQGNFEAIATDAASVTADPGQGIYVPGTGVTWRRIYTGGLLITWFGAVAGGDVTANTTAIQRTLTAAITLKVIEVIVPRADSPYDFTKVTIPLVAYDPTTGMQTIRIRGEAPPSTWFGTLPLAGFHLSNSGSILKTTATSGAGITVTQGSHGGYDFNWIRLEIKDLHGRTYDNPNITFLDAVWAQQLDTDNFIIDTGVWPTNAVVPTHSSAYGIITPGRGNGAHTRLARTIVCGYYYGIQANEHTFFDYSVVNCCLFGVQFMAADHGSTATRLSIYRCQTGLTFDGAHYFKGFLDIEHAGAASTSGPDNWQIPVRDVADLLNYAHGEITWFAVLGNVGLDNSFTTNGGANVVIKQLGEKTIPESIFTYATQSVPTSGVVNSVTFAAYATECATLKGGDATKVLITTAGTYDVEFAGSFAANSTGYRRLQIFSGAPGAGIALRTKIEEAPNGTRNTIMNLYRASFSANAGDEVYVEAFQTSGGALNLVAATADSGVLTIRKLRSSVL